MYLPNFQYVCEFHLDTQRAGKSQGLDLSLQQFVKMQKESENDSDRNKSIASYSVCS